MSTENNPSSYTPRPANGRAKIAVLALALAALALYIVSVAASAYKGVLMMGALLVVTAAIFLAYRYLFSTYTYRIFYTEDGVGYFLVEQVNQQSHNTTGQRAKQDVSGIMDT